MIEIKKGDGGNGRAGVALIALTTLLAEFKTGARRRGETERLVSTEQGLVIFREALIICHTVSEPSAATPWVQFVPLSRFTYTGKPTKFTP